MNKNAAAALIAGVLTFLGGGIAYAEAEMDHRAEALKHAQQAIEHGKQGHTNIVVERAREAYKHLKETPASNTYGPHNEKAMTHLRQAAAEAKKGNADAATKHAEAATAELKEYCGYHCRAFRR